MSKRWPTTQELLIDHLLRIIDGVAWTEEGGGRKSWIFGPREDTLISSHDFGSEPTLEEKAQNQKERDANTWKFLSSIGIEARDHMGVPKRLAKLRSELLSKDRQAFAEALNALSLGASQDAYAFEMISKLGDMVDRGRQAVQEAHLLPNVPRWVDRYMSEAASCFRYGFDLACVSLCRSALEEALKNRLIKKVGRETIEPLEEGKRRTIPLVDLIIMAVLLSILTPQLEQSAHDIRTAGNDCAHGRLKGKQVRDAASEALINSRLIIQMMYTENN